MSFIINAIKIIFILGFLVLIHEIGHFLVAKLCKIKVNEFAIGFGPVIWKKQGKKTKYALRLIPLGGFVSMEGEEERSDAEGSFSNSSIPKRIAVVMAGGLVNIIFAVITYIILMSCVTGSFQTAISYTGDFIFSMVESIKLLFSGNVTVDQLMGPVGISEVVAQTTGFAEFIYILALISMSLGVTNLLPFPPLDGGKVVLLLIEAIRRKPLKEELEIKIQMLGFALLIMLSIYVTYNDVVRIFKPGDVQMEKTIKEIFKDYDSNSFELNESKIKVINLFKKTNKLEIKMIAKRLIKIKDLYQFEKYIEKRFNIKNIVIEIEYENQVEPNIQEEWKDIVEYMAYKHPLTRALLKNSFIKLNQNELEVVLTLKGKEVLEARGFEKILSLIVKNIYGKSVKVKFVENITEEMLEQLRQQAEQFERETVLRLQREAEEYVKEMADNPASEAKKVEKKNISHPQEKAPAPNLGEVPPPVFEPPMEEEKTPLIYGRSLKIKEQLTKVADLSVDSGNVLLDGEILNIDSRELKSGKVLVMFDLFDGSSTITCKVFSAGDKSKELIGRIKGAKGIKIVGTAQFDPFAKELGVIANTIIESTGIKREVRKDEAKVKRVELHMHTQMSQMDGMTAAKDLLKRAVKWGMKSIAITDHGVVQAFPEAHKYLGKDHPDLKVIYGVEAYLAPDKTPSVSFQKGQDIDTTYCVLDLETTGLSFRTEKITEVGIMKVKDGQVIDEFSCFVNPEKPIPQRVVEVTNITDDMVKDAETIGQVFPKILEFVGDSVLVAHNADFDIGFLKYNAKQLGYQLDNTYIDTLRLAKDLFPDYKKYKLGIIAEKLGIKVEVAHRALDDVDTTVKVFKVMIDMLKEKGAKKLEDIDRLESGKTDYKKLQTYHAIILAKNYVGLKNLYKLVSYSHLDYFYKRPRILKSLYKKYSEGLILGSACEAGELYRAIIAGKSDEEIEEIANDYDYLEIQPIGNNMFMIRNGTVPDEKALQEINQKIVDLGDKLGKPVVATCDVHFMDPQDEIYRRILMAGQGYDDADEQAPLYLRTTEEMLKEFEYLGEEKAYEVVVTNTNKISDMCENISPISPEKCPPHIDGCEQTIKDIAYDKAHELYGDPLPEIVEERLEKELNSIIKNGFSVMYIIAQKLVWKSNEDGYIVGSRGSVGSSFVANMTGITEVNSLPPHYRCPKCKYSDFTDYGCACGFDLPDKECPKCGERLVKDGIDIPFETFLGFNGDKEPDIDLNFSGEYQAKAHKYTEVIFGKGTTFKAGTVGTVADKTAFGYVKKYYEERGVPVNNAEVLRVAQGCTGIKRTTGQHPGGIIVVPKGREIYEFTPVQHPADDPNSDIITTHFDYHSIDQNLLKLDILGHDDPTMIRMLYDITGIDPTKVPLDDKETMSIFGSTKALGVTPEQIKSEVGSYGVPEFGTKFVRGMLVDTKPTTFDELIRISGLSHGTDVWLGNAQSLIEQGTVTLNEAICCRDDIMIYLIKKGVPPNPAFKIMETVRKGKALKDPEKWAEYVALMKEHDVPDWYIKSCEKIKYMFPKAHAAAYVTNAFRIAWFKVHHPTAYYASYFTIRADEFDSDIMCYGEEKVKNKMKEIDLQGNSATTKDKNMYAILELVLEMYERGIKFLPIDLYKSHATKFLIEDGAIRPPLNSIPGLGTVAALGIEKAKQDGKFMSIDDMKIRSKVGNSVVEMLTKVGCLNGMSQSNQMSLFG